MITATEVSQRLVESYYKLYSMRMIKNKTEFCSRTQMYMSNFALIERGERQASLSNIMALIDNLKVSPNWLFLGIGEPFTFLEEEQQ